VTTTQTGLAESAALQLKMQILHYGVVPTPALLDRYGPPYLEKRRAYGNADDLAFVGRSLPQEAYLGDTRIIVAMNVRPESPWIMDWEEEFGFFVRHRDGGERVSLDFPRYPAFYDYPMSDGGKVKNIITLYGGGSLGVFVYGRCALVDMGKACHYCSIEPNRSKDDVDFAYVVAEKKLREALTLALKDEEAPIKQVMLNGGNFPDPDKSFLYYARLVATAREVIDASGRDVELHLIVYPPEDLELFSALRGQNVGVAMNTEVYDSEIFARICPGKTVVGGQQHLHDALCRAAEILEPGSVHSIFVGGLEPQYSMTAGMEFLAAHGVTPIINVFHADPGTPLYSHPEPSLARIQEMGEALEGIFSRHSFMRPFYLDCGRNSIDTEAYLQLFSQAAPVAGR
jgi:hypothetical protein